MIASIGELNRERKNRSEPPIRVSVGLHYGQVVLGDIGLNRLEFAVIGTTVNAASRLEIAYPRIRLRHGGQRRRWCSRRGRKPSSSNADFALLVEQPPRTIRGLEQPVGIWTCANIAP